MQIIYQSNGQSERMMEKYRLYGTLRYGIITKLIHKQRDRIRDAKIKECT